MKVKVKLFKGGKMPESFNGDLYDLFTAEDVSLKAPQAGIQYKDTDGVKYRDVNFDTALVRLGIAMEIPKGFKVNLYPRSSTSRKWTVIFGNSVGQIDSSYSGDNDEWKASVVAIGTTSIPAHTRIAQFEIVPSCKATFWQKLKWLFSSKIEFVEVDHLNMYSRGGFGSTGYYGNNSNSTNCGTCDSWNIQLQKEA